MILQTFAITLLTAHLACLAPVNSMVPKQLSPIAPRGGVMMVPLYSDTPSNQWPSQMKVSFDSGTTATGLIGWIEPQMTTSSWTSSPFRIRPVSQEDDARLIDFRDKISGPVLLIEIPKECSGDIQIGNIWCTPRYFDVPESLPHLNLDEIPVGLPIQFLQDDKFPEPNALEFWRWTLIASKHNQILDLPPFSSKVEQFAARHGQCLWRIGLHQLATSSRGVAAACRDLLINTARDGEHEFACWIVKPNALHALLSILLEQHISSDLRIQQVLEWIDDQPQFVFWVDQLFGDKLHLAFTNPTLESTIAAIMWQQIDGDLKDIPIALEIPAKQTVRTTVDRMPNLLSGLDAIGPATLESTLQWLTVQFGSWSTTIPITPPTVEAKPPSVSFSYLHPTWTLQTIKTRNPAVVAEQLKTTVELRYMFKKWELFFSCNGNARGNQLPQAVRSIEEIRGVEAISIVHQPSATLICVTPENAHTQLPFQCESFTSIGKDGWNARVVLPSSWIIDDTITFAVARTHGGSNRVETGPLPCVPWKIDPSPISVDVSSWAAVTQFPVRLKPSQ